MFGLFAKKNPHKENALALYAAAMEQSRDPWFYEAAGVPDSYDGRFDCLLLHIYLIIQKLNANGQGQQVAQALFDTAIADFDQSLREIGVGDTGMKRRMKNMMLAFNGRMHAYQDAKESGESAVWQVVLRRNLFGTLETVTPFMITLMQDYVECAIEHIEAQSETDILGGKITFPVPEEESKWHDTRKADTA